MLLACTQVLISLEVSVNVKVIVSFYFNHPEYYRQSSDPKRRSCDKCYSAYSADIGACPCCFVRDNCLCGNMKFYDSTYGVFPYCSPSCRDKYFLPSYNDKLQEDLKKNPLRSDGGTTTAGGDFSSTVQCSPPVTSGLTGVAGTRTANIEAIVTALQCNYICYEGSTTCQ